MQDFGSAFGLAFRLVWSADPDLLEIIALSLRVSLTAVALGIVLLTLALSVNAAVMALRMTASRHAHV